MAEAMLRFKRERATSAEDMAVVVVDGGRGGRVQETRRQESGLSLPPITCVLFQIAPIIAAPPKIRAFCGERATQHIVEFIYICAIANDFASLNGLARSPIETTMHVRSRE